MGFKARVDPLVRVLCHLHVMDDGFLSDTCQPLSSQYGTLIPFPLTLSSTSMWSILVQTL